MLVILFGGLTAFLLWAYLTGLTTTISVPPYEETHSVPSRLSGEIKRIDRALYESLYQERIPEKSIRFLGVKPKHVGMSDWDFTEVLVRLPTKSSLRRLRRTLEATLGPLKPEVSVRVEKVSEREFAFHVFALGSHTHKIRLNAEPEHMVFYGELPKVSIIIDDFGPERGIAESFVHLDIPLSISVLPLMPYSRLIASKAGKKGCELLLHLPMEPKDYPEVNPGPGVLLAGMEAEEIRRILDENLRSVPGARGVNNHMGSRFTEKEEKMAVLLRELKRRNLFYVDSRTTRETVAYEVAKRVGVPTVRRGVFLDNELFPHAMTVQMERLLGMARHSGSAVGIGHPHDETLRLLKKFLPKLKTEVRVVPVSNLVN